MVEVDMEFIKDVEKCLHGMPDHERFIKLSNLRMYDFHPNDWKWMEHDTVKMMNDYGFELKPKGRWTRYAHYVKVRECKVDSFYESGLGWIVANMPLTAARVVVGLSLRDMDAELGYSYGFIGKVERGDEPDTIGLEDSYWDMIEEILDEQERGGV